MKTIKIISHPIDLDRILSALSAKGMNQVTVTELKQFGGSPRSAWHRGTTYLVHAASKIQFECVASEFGAHELVEAVVASQSGRRVDLKIYVSDTEEIPVAAPLAPAQSRA